MDHSCTLCSSLVKAYMHAIKQKFSVILRDKGIHVRNVLSMAVEVVMMIVKCLTTQSQKLIVVSGPGFRNLLTYAPAVNGLRHLDTLIYMLAVSGLRYRGSGIYAKNLSSVPVAMSLTRNLNS